jgi:RNA polymerase sigma-70 factor (ECF subfamily)
LNHPAVSGFCSLVQIERTESEWARQVDEHLPAVYRFLFGLCRNQAEAEDLAQQAFWRARRGGAYEGSERAWLLRIAYREFLNWRRRAWRVVALPFHMARTEAGFEMAEAGIDLHRALGKLSTEMRAAFLLVEVDDMTIAEAAKALGVPDGTIKSRVHRARQRLRELLEPAQDNENEQRVWER